MKRFKNFLLGVVATLLLLLSLAAATATRRSLPADWGTATTGFGLDANGVPGARIAGTNFAGITTNAAFVTGAGTTNTLRIRNGIVTQVY